MKYLVVAAVLNLLLAGVAMNNDVIPNNFPSDVYIDAQRKLQEGNYKEAISKLQSLYNHYPFGKYTQQIQLDLIYAYYKSADLQLAKAFIDYFLRFNPCYSNIDYLLYIRSLTKMVFNDSESQVCCAVKQLASNLASASGAFNNFKQLLIAYPKSQYTISATNYLIALKEMMAKHEISVVEYYEKIGSYVAVANRMDKMIREFPDTKATRQTLHYMRKAYRKLQLYV